jgi:hypothetical protein
LLKVYKIHPLCTSSCQPIASMQLFQNILSSLHQKILIQQESQSAVTDVINSVLGTSLTNDQVKIKDGVLIVSSAPTIKLTLKLKERLVREALQEKGFSITSIR